MLDWRLVLESLQIFTRAVELFYDDPRACVPVLKFMVGACSAPHTHACHRSASLCRTRTTGSTLACRRRTAYCCSARPGTLQLRCYGRPCACSKLVAAYGNRLLSLPPPDSPDDVYPLKYKAIAVCYNVLKCRTSPLPARR